jgi:hypothetical protein
MPKPEKCALAVEMADRLLELYARRDEARRGVNWQEARDLQNQIEEISTNRNKLLAGSHRKKRCHVRDKAVRDQLADKGFKSSSNPANQQSPTTSTDLPVERQVRKKRDPKNVARRPSARRATDGVRWPFLGRH